MSSPARAHQPLEESHSFVGMLEPHLVDIVARNPDAARGIEAMYASSSPLLRLIIREITTLQKLSPAERNELLTRLETAPPNPHVLYAFCLAANPPIRSASIPSLGDTRACYQHNLELLGYLK